MNLLYDRLLKKAEPLAARGNAYIAEAQVVIDKIEDKTGYGRILPTYTGKDVLRGLGIESPYDHIATSFVMAASMNLNGFTLTLLRAQPLKSSRDGPARTSLTLGKDF
jgi:hypothetical protein